MRTRTAKWFECAVTYDKTHEDGLTKKTTERIAVDALSFSEAEECAIDEMAPYISGGLEVTAIQIASYKAVFFSEDSKDDKWYKVKVAFITIDEKTEKGKRQKFTYLVQASSSENALANTNECFKGSMSDYEIVDVNETKILDVYEHTAKNEGKEGGEGIC